MLPAFTPRERQVATPLMLMVPGLFSAGAVFAYFAVLPPAIKFLQNYNSSSFDILVQARDYYRFELLTMLSLGVLFQMPSGSSRSPSWASSRRASCARTAATRSWSSR